MGNSGSRDDGDNDDEISLGDERWGEEGIEVPCA